MVQINIVGTSGLMPTPARREFHRDATRLRQWAQSLLDESGYVRMTKVSLQLWPRSVTIVILDSTTKRFSIKSWA